MNYRYDKLIRTVYYLFLCFILWNDMVMAVEPDKIVTVGESVQLSATASDQDCHYITGLRPRLETDSAIAITWTAVLRNTSTSVGSFPNGNTGSFVKWLAPCSACDVTIRATASNAASTKAIDGNATDDIWIKVEPATIQEVVWGKYEDNDLQGDKIFPDKLNYTDNCSDSLGLYKRHRVYIKAKINSQCENIPIYFRWFDADDPSTSSVIDPGGIYDADNHDSASQLPDNVYTAEPHWNVQHIAMAYTNANGEANVIFQVSFAPGDNFQVAASLSQDSINNLTPWNYYHGNIPDSIILSSVLTVWRKLWIERDTMNSSTSADGSDEQNYIIGTAGACNIIQSSPFYITEFDLLSSPQWLIWEEYLEGKTDELVEGRYFGGNNQPPFQIIKSNTPNWPAGDVRVRNDASGIGLDFKMYDNDEGNWTYNSGFIWNPDPVLPQYVSLGTKASEYHRAYIEPIYLDVAYSDTISFDRNLSVYDVTYGLGQWDAFKDVSNSSMYWSVFVINAFQPGLSEDGDPITEDACHGITSIVDSACAIYLETIRGGYAIKEVIMAHEIGHAGGAVKISEHITGHCPDTSCIMVAGAGGDHFCDSCILNLRNQISW